jgi:hypothetical protein
VGAGAGEEKSMSKGSRNRTTDWKAYRKGWERCFGKKKRTKKVRKTTTQICGHPITIVESPAMPDDAVAFVPDYVKDMTE